MAYEYKISRRRNNLTISHPHMWIRYGVWHCSSARAKGTGKTPRAAYIAWAIEERVLSRQRAMRERMRNIRHL